MVIFNFSFNRSEIELKCLLDTTIFKIYLALLPSKIVQERGDADRIIRVAEALRPSVHTENK